MTRHHCRCSPRCWLRHNFERMPQAVEAGYARVMGFDATAIHEEMLHLAGAGRPSHKHPHRTGDAARRIVDIVEEWMKR